MMSFNRLCSQKKPSAPNWMSYIALALFLLQPALPAFAQDALEDSPGVEPEAEGLPADEPNELDEDELEERRHGRGDWGVTVDALRSIRAAGHQGQDARTSAISGALWARRVSPVGELSTIDSAIQGSYNWSSGQTYLNLDLLRFRGFYPELLGSSSVVEATAGRFRFQDPSNLILSSTADGLSLQIAYPSVRLLLGASYTGFMLNPASNVRMTGADLLEQDDDDEDFGPRRAVGLAEISFPELFARQTIVLSALGQFDLRDADDDEATVNSGYAVAGIRGPLFGSLYHDIYGAGTMGSVEIDDGEDYDYIGYLGSARLRLFVPNFFASRFSLRGVYASSGEIDEGDNTYDDRFRPVTRTRFGTAIALPLENLLMGELQYSVRPFAGSDSERARRFQLVLTGRTFFTTADEPVVLDPTTEVEANEFGDYPGYDDDPGNYIGSEAVLQLNARPLSDLGLGFTAGMFFPGTGSSGAFTNAREPQFLGRVELSTRF